MRLVFEFCSYSVAFMDLFDIHDAEILLQTPLNDYRSSFTGRA
jgi:hypothetical protein